MKIRKSKIGDAPELIELIQLADNRTLEVASKKVKKFVNSDQGFFIVATEKNEIIGYLLFMIREEDVNAEKFLDTEKHACICWIAVHPNFRKRNIGSKLLKESEKYARKYDKLGLWLDCTKTVVGFYEKNNFEVAGIYQKETLSGLLRPCYVMTKSFKVKFSRLPSQQSVLRRHAT